MSTALTRGANVVLTELAPGLRRVLVGLGWTAPTGDYQVDLAVLLTGDDGRVPTDDYVVFASQLDAAATPGPEASAPTRRSDAEQIEVDLTDVPDYVARIVFTGTLYSALPRRQSFGQLHNLYIQLSDLDSGRELVRYTLDHDAGSETSLAFGELYRHRSGWKFRAVGQGWADGLAGLARDYGAQLTS
ncbi:MAG: TerD family protein [Actinomycetales bacterium]